MNNPFSLTFGKKPAEYINRRDNIDEIKNAFLREPARCQTYLICGVRGCGKTVLMTALSKELSELKEWVCVDLNPAQNLLEDLSYRLTDACESTENILDRGLDISAAGFGIGIGNREPRDSVSKCEKIFETFVKKNKKVLITIDEVCNDKSMKQFVSQFQIWLRKDYPIFLLMTGLYENIYALQNNPQLTFLLRSPKVTLGPLGITQIARQYESALHIPTEEAITLAKLTKGYAFAFQALGMLYWDYHLEMSLQQILRKLDEYLDDYVYKKIWSGLSNQDQNIIMHIPDNKEIKVKELCEATEMTSSAFSKYRERLSNKGLINVQKHGYVELTLPRFHEVCKLYLMSAH